MTNIVESQGKLFFREVHGAEHPGRHGRPLLRQSINANVDTFSSFTIINEQNNFLRNFEIFKKLE